MNHKVLLADDSLTIQKVIKITLANQPYDITDCSNEDELFQKLTQVQPKLVFLDFNLSEKFTGYELTTKIKTISPATKVLLLLGTFDTVDDSAMEKCGASDKIVKPFDSNKFIAICKQLTDSFVDEEIPYPEAKSPAPISFDNPDDQWTVSHTTEQKLKEDFDKPLDDSFPTIENPLAKEMSDWGMSVPGIINDTGAHELKVDLPPVIGEVKSLNDHRAKAALDKKYEQKFPDNSDLDYPSLESKEALSKLISIDSFNEDAPGLELEGSYVPDESDVKSIEAQIRDEVEDNLWIADEFEDLKKEVSSKIEEVKNNFQPNRSDFDESLFKPLDDQESIDWEDHAGAFEMPAASDEKSEVNVNELRSEMESMVKKYVKEYLDELFLKNTEKIAWEVIPDLAENLIRQELTKISNKILDDQN